MKDISKIYSCCMNLYVRNILNNIYLAEKGFMTDNFQHKTILLTYINYISHF